MLFMKFQVIAADTSKLLIANEMQVPGVVLMFPITRVSDSSLASWQHFMELIERSKLHAIVVIDKSPQFQATDFFLDQSEKLKCLGYIVQREGSEGIFDSQKIVYLETNLWITQVHDDDGWAGVISLPASPTRNTVFVPTIVDEQMVYKVSDSIKIPAHTLFSLVPGEAWNSFTAYIEAQGGHIAPSGDSTLNFITSSYCDHERLEGYTYKYSARHWQGRRQVRKELRKLSDRDGWGTFSGVTAAVLTAQIDRICFSLFLRSRELVPFQNQDSDFLIEQVASSKKSKLLKLIPLCLIPKLSEEKIILIKGSLKITWLNKILSPILRFWLQINLSKTNDLRSLNQLMKSIRLFDLSNSLNKRIDYWTSAITIEILN
jgi:hypothetical protein